jgi:hypothetical protein
MPATFDPGRLVMVDLPGRELDRERADFLREQGIRAVCLFRKNLGSEDAVRRLTAQLREVLGPYGLIGLDQEGGSVVRSTTLPQPPSAMSLGAGADPERSRAVGAAVARGLRRLGVNWNFAPVLDVNNNPANPVIAERAFSDEPEGVARLAGAWMEGSLAEGVACCVKHFPGHGDTHVDSHHDLPWVDKSRAELEPLAQGSEHEQSLAVQAIEAALREGELLPTQALRAQARLQALAHRFPVAPRPYPSDERAADDALMRHAWARGLRTLGGATPPALDRPLEVVTQASVASDGVSEAGIPSDPVAALFAGHTDVRLLTVPDLTDPSALDLPPCDPRRLRVLVSNQRRRYPAAAARWPVDLHLSAGCPAFTSCRACSSSW